MAESGVEGSSDAPKRAVEAPPTYGGNEQHEHAAKGESRRTV